MCCWEPKQCGCLGKQAGSASEAKRDITICQLSLVNVYTQGEWKCMSTQRLAPSVCRRSIHSSHKAELLRFPSTAEWANKMCGYRTSLTQSSHSLLTYAGIKQARGCPVLEAWLKVTFWISSVGEENVRLVVVTQPGEYIKIELNTLHTLNCTL